MHNYTTVQIDNDTLLDMLCDRLLFWIEDSESDEFKVFSNYYEQLIDEGCFDNIKLNINEIVDNDYVNYLSYYASIDEATEEYGPEFVATHINYDGGDLGILISKC